MDSNTEYATGILDLFDVRSGEWVGSISEDGHAARRRQHVTDEFKAFFREPRRTGQPSDVAARPRQAKNETGSNWIARPRHDDWNLCRRMPRRGNGRRQRRDDDIDLEKNQFVSQPAQALRLAIGGAELERDALPLDVAVLAQARMSPPKAAGDQTQLSRARIERPMIQSLSSSDRKSNSSVKCAIRCRYVALANELVMSVPQ